MPITGSNSQVSTASSSNNYFRQIGASIGTAVVGSLFIARLTDLMSTRLSVAVAGVTGDTNSLTPAALRDLPDAVREIIVSAYNDALAPVLGRDSDAESDTDAESHELTTVNDQTGATSIIRSQP